MRFHSLEVALYLYKSTIRPCMDWAGALLCFMSGLVPLVATWNCWISYKKGYAGLSVPHLLLLLNPFLITKMQPALAFSVAIILVDVHLNQLNWFNFLFLEGGLLVILIDCMIFLLPFLGLTRCLCQQCISLYSSNKLWKSLCLSMLSFEQ